MASKRLLTIFGATGNQGGSVLDVVLAHPDLLRKYALRGITRDPSSAKSKKLSAQGVEMVQADVDNLESLRSAVRGSHGVFGVTDFWSILDKQREIQQGKNIFDASKAEGVKHLVFSSLDSAEKMTNGRLTHVDHFDAKALAAEYMEENKSKGGGQAITVSFVQPAMFIEGSANARVMEGTPTIALPFPNENIDWPLLQARRDTGKYVIGLFEGGEAADGVKVHAVSTWTTPKEVVQILSNTTGQDVVFKPLPVNVFEGILVQARGEQVGKELAEMMAMIGEPGYYGKGAKEQQKEHDKWLLPGSDLISYEQWARESGPKKFE